MFLKPAGIDGLDPAVDAIDGQLGRAQPNNRTMTLMCFMDGPVALHPEPLPKDPCRREGCGEVSTGDPGKGGKKYRIDEKFEQAKQ
jgi:hypothetical protein